MAMARTGGPIEQALATYGSGMSGKTTQPDSVPQGFAGSDFAGPYGSGTQGSGGVIEVELAQGLGLSAALTIGVGTMIGSGIFILPGLIFARTGPATLLSFVIGGVIALLSAMSAAEVATGMPKSGGGYYFVSRALGPMWGSVIGWSNWFGLVFASAFYMVGFGEYVAAYLGTDIRMAAIVMTAALVALNLIGSQAAGRAQNLLVGVLLASLLLFIGRGSFSAHAGVFSGQAFMPYGIGAVIAGTATLFVNYCGFTEIASMAEEIRDPARNLPRALLGSVLIVVAIYVAVILVCLMLKPTSELTGSALIADLAAAMLGPWGRGAMMIGAIMAMLSSTNASIMSAARIAFAMSRDNLVWSWLNRVHPKFRVPHTAILVTGAMIFAGTMIGNIELLAEAAGMLHLLLYGLIGVACVVMRGARQEAYNPIYRVPLFPWLPLAGSAGCFAIIFFMQPLVVYIGSAIVALAVIHYYFFGRKRTSVEGVWPYFLRWGILEPAIDSVEAWGARPESIPRAMVAVANPEHEAARLQIAAGMMGPIQGDVLAVTVFHLDFSQIEEEGTITRYHQFVADRERQLQKAAAPLIRAGAKVRSHVAVAGSIFCGLLSSAEASRASLVFLGWPDKASPGYTESLQLLDGLDQYLRANVLVLREAGPVPARTILAVVEDGPHSELVLTCAARLANTWGAQLTVAGVVAENADADTQSAMEKWLEGRIGDRARANTRAIPATSVAAAIKAETAFVDMVITGAPDVPARALYTSIGELGQLDECSLVLVRAASQHPNHNAEVIP